MSWNEAWVLQIQWKNTRETASKLRSFCIIHVVPYWIQNSQLCVFKKKNTYFHFYGSCSRATYVEIIFYKNLSHVGYGAVSWDEVLPVLKEGSAVILRVKQLFLNFVTLKRKALHSCKTLGTSYSFTQHYIPEVVNLSNTTLRTSYLTLQSSC